MRVAGGVGGETRVRRSYPAPLAIIITTHLRHQNARELHAPAALVLVLHQQLGVLPLLHARGLEERCV